MGGVDELHLTCAILRLAVGEHPDVGGNAGVVEHVQREGDDGLEPVVLDNPAADVALALASASGEERGAVMHLGNPATERGVVLHLAQHVGEKEHLAVAGAGEEVELGVTSVFDDESGIADVLLGAATGYTLEVALPAFPIGRVGEHEVEFFGAEGVVGERGVLGATDDVVGCVTIALQQEVGFADSVDLAVDFLAVKVSGDLLAVLLSNLLEGVFRDGEHPPGAAGAIVEEVGAGFDLVGDRQEHEVGHQPDCIARCPVLSGFLVVVLIELQDEVLEERAHRVVIETGKVANSVRGEVDVLVEELLDELAENVSFGKTVDLIAELEVRQDVLHVGRESIEVGDEVVFELLPRSAGL